MNNPQIPRPSSYRRCKTPTMIQMEATECGAVALSIILAYYGRYITLEEARIACSVSRNGSNALHLLYAARYFGLKVEAFEYDLEGLYEATLPLIAYWNFDHFLVIEGYDKKYVYINDPAHGPKRITYPELNESFTGLALTLEPGADFKPSQRVDHIWEDIWQKLKLFRVPLIFSLILGLLAMIPQLAMPVLSQVFVDRILIDHVYEWKWGILAAASGTILLATGINFLQTWILTRLSIQFSIVLSGNFFWHILRLPLLFYLQRYGGEIASRISLNETVSETIIGTALSTIINVIFAFLLVIIMLYYDVSITLIGLAVVLINLLLMIRLYRFRSDAYANYQQIQGRLTSFAIGGLETIESLKAVGREHNFLVRYGALYTNSLNTLQSMSRNDLILGTFSPFFSILGSMSVLMVGSWRIIQGRLTIGEFLALQMLYNNFVGPMLGLVNLNQTLQLLRINMTRLHDVLRNKKDPAFDQHALKQLSEIDRLQGYIELRNITYGFSPLDLPLLEDIQLSLSPGQTVALVGPSGCGKSTLIKIIGGLFKPWSGEILLDGIPSDQYPRDVITRSLAIVEQAPALFKDSLQNNITLMDPSMDQKSLIRAAQDALIHDEIMSRPGGYQSLVERQGENFSGGQRQRLEIACALFGNPSILLLDEATSAIDSTTETDILENIRRRGCACLIVAHRLSTIRNCDKIYVMESGKIVQQGTHEELIKQKGLYQKLVYAEEIYHINQ